jgi:hypothetical protein
MATFRGTLAVAVLGLSFLGGGGGCARVQPGVVSGDGAAPSDTSPSNTVPAPDLSMAADVPALPGACVNLECRRVQCAGAPTTISGTAFAPNGTLPLYNVIVYVPNAPLEPFKPGVSCDRCGVVASGRPIATAVSNEEGKFTLTNVPAGKDIPLVFQVGKWRRKVTLPDVMACQDNPISDPELTRLPRNRREGDLPRIAVTTGACDQLGCLLPKIGVDVAELGIPGEDKAVAYYRDSAINAPNGSATFGPDNMPPAPQLWSDEAILSRYDLTLLSCECAEVLQTKSATALSAMTGYLGRGGRIFGSHFSYVWLRDSPDRQFATAAAIAPNGPGVPKGPMVVDTTFPKGKALADWMKFLDPTITYGQIVSEQIYNDIVGATRPAAQTWATSPTDNPFGSGALPSRPRIVTVNTPVGLPAEQQCGRAAQLEAHITALPSFVPSSPQTAFPGVCGTKLNKGEEALAFLFFDLAACIQDDSKPVIPPLVIP